MKLKQLEALAQAANEGNNWEPAAFWQRSLHRNSEAEFVAAHDPARMLRIYALLAEAQVWHACQGVYWAECPGCVWEKKREDL